MARTRVGKPQESDPKGIQPRYQIIYNDAVPHSKTPQTKVPTQGYMQASATKVHRKKQIKRTQGDVSRNSSAESGLDQFLHRHGARIVALLCVYAGLRILILAAAFPIFNSIDEQFHFASIQMYARGQWPGKDLPRVDSESAKLFSLYGTLEYTNTRDKTDRVPVYQLPLQEMVSHVSPRVHFWLNRPNFEAQSTPLYYLLGAGWYRFGKLLGMQSWELSYWVRFLNPAGYALLVWVSCRLVRKVYPERVFLWLGVPALLAVFPQDVYFGMNRDVLSAPMTAVALLLMVKAVDEKGNATWLLIMSLLVGLTFLVNVSNVVLYGALAVTLWFWVRLSPATSLKKTTSALGSVWAAVALPLLWMLRNYVVMDDLTGSRAKVAIFGWTVKPLSEVFDHPIFSWDGLSYFLVNLTKGFWCGDNIWHREPMRLPPADWFYVLSSAVMIAIFSVRYFRRWKSGSLLQRLAEFQALFLIVTSVLFMAAISMAFDFHDFPYPSREHPFFISGRIISGALLPFVLIYVSGMELLLTRLRKWVHPVAILACLMVFITVTEFQVRRVVFSSPNNFFALRSWQQGSSVRTSY